MKKIITTSLFIIMGVQISLAQSFSPDRPGIGNGSYITPKNMLGVEAGIQYLTVDNFSQVDFGQLLFRYGIADKLELRASLNSFSYQEYDIFGNEYSTSGFQDMAIGAKYNLLNSTDNKFNLSALAELSLPVGEVPFTSDEFRTGLGLLADYSITDNFALSSNLNYSFETETQPDGLLFTLTPGFKLPGNENIGIYAGYAGYFYGNEYNEYWYEGGLTFGLENGSQLDLNFGYMKDSELIFIGVGFAKGF